MSDLDLSYLNDAELDPAVVMRLAMDSNFDSSSVNKNGVPFSDVVDAWTRHLDLGSLILRWNRQEFTVWMDDCTDMPDEDRMRDIIMISRHLGHEHGITVMNDERQFDLDHHEGDTWTAKNDGQTVHQGGYDETVSAIANA